jgi:hypothetical protein
MLKTRMATGIGAIGLAASLILPVSAHDRDNNHRDDRDHHRNIRVEVGYHIAPVPLDLKHKNKQLVGWGSYLVNAVGGCNDCHTSPPYAPGGNPFQGEREQINVEKYLAGGTPFGPGIVSRNLTPDANGHPAGLTRQQFINAIRTGHDYESSDPNDLLQVMPWPVYRNMTDTDLKAIYEYLRSIPSLPNNY